MWPFSKTIQQPQRMQPIFSEEYEILNKRIISLSTDILTLTAKMESLHTQLLSVRQKLNKAAMPEPESETNKYPDRVYM